MLLWGSFCGVWSQEESDVLEKLGGVGKINECD
jgi:hypothetical protein